MSKSISTDFTKMLNIRFPIIGAPMFLVSNEDMVVNISEAGAIGSYPSLNFRPSDEFEKSLKRIKQRTQQPIGVNLIVNKSNPRQADDLKHCLNHGVELFITSLGNPKTIIEEAHKQGAKVICDVTNLEHAKKVQDLGADGVVAVGQGAGGHAGPITPLVLIPWLKSELEIPVIAAGGIANGQTMAAAMALGASAVHVGTRFIASKEAQPVGQDYLQAVVEASPEDIVLSDRISGTPCNFIKTEYFEQVSENMPYLIKQLKKHPLSKKYVVPAIHYLGMKSLEKSVGEKTDRKKVWCAGQTVGLINEIKTCKEIVDEFISQYEETIKNMPHVGLG
tara:strand:+ start:126352 stop:127356 length:1005 start_codon:yes stop_codon:yes gene_type:complete